MVYMTDTASEFTLEAHVAQVVANSNQDHRLVAEIIRTSTVPRDAIQRIMENNSWIDEKILNTILGDSNEPTPDIFDADQLNDIYLKLGLTTDEMDARYEYHMNPVDSTLQPKSDETNEFYVVEELGFVDFGAFVIGRTSQPLLIVDNDPESSELVVRGKSAVNALMVCPKEFLDLSANTTQEVWAKAGVTAIPSLAGGYAYRFTGDFAVLNAYACDIMGIPYNDGDLAMIPVDVAFTYEDLIVEDPATATSVPIFMPLS